LIAHTILFGNNWYASESIRFHKFKCWLIFPLTRKSNVHSFFFFLSCYVPSIGPRILLNTKINHEFHVKDGKNTFLCYKNLEFWEIVHLIKVCSIIIYIKYIKVKTSWIRIGFWLQWFLMDFKLYNLLVYGNGEKLGLSGLGVKRKFNYIF